MGKIRESTVDQTEKITEGSIFIYCLLSSMAHHPIAHLVFVGLYYGPIQTTIVNDENPCNGSMIQFFSQCRTRHLQQRYIQHVHVESQATEFFFLMIRRPPRSTHQCLQEMLVPCRRSSKLTSLIRGATKLSAFLEKSVQVRDWPTESIKPEIAFHLA